MTGGPYAGPEDRRIYRHASPQAWRRVRSAIAPGEVLDIAADIADHVTRLGAASLRDGIAHALAVVEWDDRDRYRQQ